MPVSPDIAESDGPEIHAAVNQKGGVGKTTLIMNLAAVVHQVLTGTRGARPRSKTASSSRHAVLVASADPQASSIWWSSNGGGEDGEGGVPFDFVQIEDAEQILALRHTPYRHLFIDLPGNLHDEDTLEATLQVADDVIVPIEPEPLSWDPTATTINEVLAPIGVPYHVVINGWDPRDGLPDLEATAEFIAANGWTVCNTIVRKYKVHSRAAAHGTVVTQYGKSRIAQEGLSDFQSLALELGYGGRTQRPVPRQPRQATGAEVRG